MYIRYSAWLGMSSLHEIVWLKHIILHIIVTQVLISNNHFINVYVSIICRLTYVRKFRIYIGQLDSG